HPGDADDGGEQPHRPPDGVARGDRNDAPDQHQERAQAEEAEVERGDLVHDKAPAGPGVWGRPPAGPGVWGRPPAGPGAPRASLPVEDLPRVLMCCSNSLRNLRRKPSAGIAVPSPKAQMVLPMMLSAISLRRSRSSRVAWPSTMRSRMR